MSAVPVSPASVGLGRLCDWTDCAEAAVAELGFNVKPVGSPVEVDVGDVMLCRSHLELARRTGRLTLDWARIAAAKASE